MAPRLPRLIAVLAMLAAAAGGARAQDTPAARALGRDVVTRAMIEEVGILRLGEVVRLAPRWNATTVDDFTWRAAPRALSTGAEDSWVLLVDGRPVEIGALGTASLERLPIDLASIDSIVFVSAPVVADGVYSPAGLIHIHTQQPAHGASARARLGFGSETGDPGPFAFLPAGRPNRDRYGHESAVEGAVARGRWYAAASYSASVHLPTDPLILSRMYASSGLTPRIERIAPALRIGIDGDGGGHHLLGGTSRIDDWQRLDLAGVEVPVRSTLSHLGAAGSLRLPGFALGYRAGYERSHITSLQATAPPFDFAWHSVRGMLEVRHPGTTERRIGVTFDRRTARRAGPQSLGRETAVGAFGELALRSAARFRHHVAAALSSSPGEGAEGGVVLTNTLAASGGDFVLRLDAGRNRAMPPTGLLELASDGEPWLEEVGTTIELPARAEPIRSAGAELGWTSRPAGRTTTSASLFLRAFDGALALRRDLAWDPVFRAWRGPVQARATAGRLAGGHLNVHHRVSSTITMTADADVVEAFGESDFRRAAEPLPALRGSLAAMWKPIPGFGLRGELEIETERRWRDYLEADAGPGKARPAQPGGVTGSVSGWKTFFDGRLRGQVAARNLTGRRIILHPEGRASALAFLFLLGGDF